MTLNSWVTYFKLLGQILAKAIRFPAEPRAGGERLGVCLPLLLRIPAPVPLAPGAGVG